MVKNDAGKVVKVKPALPPKQPQQQPPPQQQQQQQPSPKEASSESKESSSDEHAVSCFVCGLNMLRDAAECMPVGSRFKHVSCTMSCRRCKQTILLEGALVPLVLKNNAVYHLACREQQREQKKLSDPKDRKAQREISDAVNAAARAAEADLRARQEKVLVRQLSHKSMTKFANGSLKFRICLLGATTTSLIKKRVFGSCEGDEKGERKQKESEEFSLSMRIGDRSIAGDSSATVRKDSSSLSDVVSARASLFRLSILDTGSAFYAENRERWIAESDAFIICYAVDDDQSFARAQEIREDVLKTNNYRFVPMILVASKADLPETAWAVSKNEGVELAAYYRCPFVEVSPLTGAGVFEAFDTLCEQLQQLVDSVSAPTNHHTGWLRKRGHVRKNWKRRWFVLTGTSMRYYSKQTLTDVTALKGVIPLRGCRLLAPGSVELSEAKRGVGKKDRSHLLVLKLESGIDYFLLAESEAEYDEWSAHIEMLISHAELRAAGGGSFASDVALLSPSSSFIAESDSSRSDSSRASVRGPLSMMSISSDSLQTPGSKEEESFVWTPVKAKPGNRDSRATLLRPSWHGADEDERQRSDSTRGVEFVRNIHIGASRPSAQTASLERLANLEAAARNSAAESASRASEDEAEKAKLRTMAPADAIRLACKTFNKDPRRGIRTLLATEAVGSMPEAIANFLLQGTQSTAHTSEFPSSSTSSSSAVVSPAALPKQQHKLEPQAGIVLYKTKVGEYLGEPGEFEGKVLRAYVRLFPFAGLSIDAALRMFLEKFRLPGEAQKIDRIMEVFAGWYCEVTDCGNGVFKSSDAAYILAFSLIMLNTDAHNDAVKNKMTKEQFRKNNRGINAGDDLPEPFLDELFDTIVANEIILESEDAERDDLSGWEKQGWLEVKTGGSWYKKFCILAAHCLYMFERPTSSEPPELILPLMNITLDEEEGEVLILRAADRSKIRAKKGNKEVLLDKVQLRTSAQQFRNRFEWLMRLRLNVVAHPSYQFLGSKSSSGSAINESNPRKTKSPYARLPFARP